MERIQARDKFIPDALKRGALQAALVFALSVARVGGLYAPWSLAAVAVSGGKGLGLWSLLGAGLGALVLFDFQTGLRFAASALLIYCANLAFCDTKLRARKGYAPLLAAVALLLVQSVYLVGRSAVQWALGAAASAVAAAAACGLDEMRQDGRLKLLTVLTAVTAALSQIQAAGFSPCGMMAAWLALLCVRAPSLPYTAALGALVGLVLGIIAALKRDTIFDTVATIISVIGVSVPSYVFALALSYTFGFKLRWFPMLFSAKDIFGSSVLPSVSLSMFTMASIARFTRSEMIEVLDSDYMLLAESKGISGPALIFRHALRNALIPIITVLAPLIVDLMTGSLVVEKIFAIPGVGSLLVTAIQSNDYNVVIGLSFIYSAMYIGIMLVVDLLYGIIDPRIRLAKGDD